MSERTNLVPIDAEDLLSEVQRQIDEANRAVPGPAGAVQFFRPLCLDAEAKHPLEREMAVRLAQIGQAPASPSTLRGAIGRQIILILRRIFWWQTHSISTFADVTTRAVKELLAVMDRQSDQIHGLEAALAAEMAARETLARRVESVTEEVQGLRSSWSAQQQKIERIAAELAIQRSRAKAFLGEPEGSGTASSPRTALQGEPDHEYDALYLAFEHVFRGTREEIKRRLGVYLPFLKEASADTLHLPILDLGCGRGEWLELLRDHKMNAQGRDFNVAMVDYCRGLGLDVEQGEALAHLRSLPDGSLGAVTCLHMVEHISFDSVLSLLDEIIRVLQPGGLLIIETPNPKNVTVGSYSFYLDPTHLKPLPPEMLRFFVEAAGYSNCRVLELQPAPLPAGESLNLSKPLAELFYGPRDYGLIARRP